MLERALQDPKWASRSAYSLTLSIDLLIAVLFLVGQFNRNLLGQFSDYLTPLLALITLVMAILVVREAGVRLNDRTSLVWFSFMLTLVFWFLFEVASSVYPIVLGVPTPYLSFADILGLAGYFPVMFGLLMLVWPFKEVYTNKKLRGILLLVLMLSAVLIAILLTSVPQTELPASVTNLAYSVLDVVALAIAIPALAIFLKGTFWRPLLFLVVGLIMALMAQVLFEVAAMKGSYYSGDLSDLIYDWGYLSAILGFYLRRRQLFTKSI